MNNRIISILVTDGETHEALKFVRCLGNAVGVRIEVQSACPSARGRYSRYCSQFHCCQLSNGGEWLNFLRSLVGESKPDLVVPIKEPTIKIFSENYGMLSEANNILAMPPFASLYTTLNKWRFQNYIEMLKLPSIPSILVGIVGDKRGKITVNTEQIKYPALLKPTEKGGGSGIWRVNSSQEFEQLWMENRVLPRGTEYLLQSYLEGIDYCLQLYARGGEILAYTIQKSLQVEDNLFGPQRIMEFVENEEILGLSRRLIKELEWDGFACIDFRQTVETPSYRFLEVNPRIGQAILGSMQKGVNLALIGCRESLGLGLSQFKYEPGLYTHPKAYVKAIIQGVARGEIHKEIKWCNSGLRFVCEDPKPELVEMLRKIMKWSRA